MVSKRVREVLIPKAPVVPEGLTGPEATAVQEAIARGIPDDDGAEGQINLIDGGAPVWVYPIDVGILPPTLRSLAVEQVGIVADWQTWLNGDPGFVGEVGWPNGNWPANPNTPTDHRDDQYDWQVVGEMVYRALDKVNAGATYFMAGGKHLVTHNMAAYVSDTAANGINRVMPPAKVIERHLLPAALRGVNVNAWDFSGNQPDMPTLADLQFLAGRGITTIRVHHPLAEIVTSPGGALDSGYISLLDTLIANCTTAGLGLVLMVNWDAGFNGNYLHASTGDWTQADLIDLWQRLSDEYKAEDTVVAYALGNEPNNMASLPASGYAAGENAWAFPSDTMGAFDYHPTLPVWEAAEGHDAVGSISLSFTTGGGYVDGKVGIGYGLAVTTDDQAAVWAKVEAGAGTNWYARLDLINNYTITDSGPPIALPAGVWTQVTAELPFANTGQEWLSLAIINPGGPAGTWKVYIDDFSTGTAAVPPKTPAQHWEGISQAVVTDLRTTKSDTKPIIVPTYDYAMMSRIATQHPDGPWITDSADATSYDSHLYFDDNGGYPDIFATRNAEAVSDGTPDNQPLAVVSSAIT